MGLLLHAFYSEVILAAICIWSELGHPILQVILDDHLAHICYTRLNQGFWFYRAPTDRYKSPAHFTEKFGDPALSDLSAPVMAQVWQVATNLERIISSVDTTCRRHLPPSQLQTPAAQNLFQNKHAPEEHWTNKNHTSLLAQHHIPKKSVSVGQGYSHRFLILQVLTFKCRAGSTFCRGHTLQLQTPAAQNLFQNKHAP